MRTDATNGGPVLDVRGLTKSFAGVPAITGVSFTVETAEVVALTGVNGSGKSTLLRCILGLTTPDIGDVFFEGRRFDERDPAIRAAVAVALGPGDEFIDLTAREHLEFMARAHGNGSPDALVDELLGQLDLQRVANHFPYALSQGQRRRLGLASCFVRPRRLLVFDEPEQNLDVAGRRWLAGRILAEQAAGVSVLLASHDPALVEQVADSELRLEIDDDATDETSA